MDKVKIVIPARKGSKGLPFKNRKLLKYTLGKIPEDFLLNTIVSTNDEEIKKEVNKKCIVHNRSEKKSQDKTSTLSAMKEIVSDLSLQNEETIIMLYLTYPERNFEDIQEIYSYFVNNRLKSLLCKKEIKTNPYLCMYDLGNGKGKQVIEHDLYRRQEYPKIFEICHYVCIFKISELEKLNNNMYNSETYFYKIDDKIDVDYEIDLERFLNDEKN